MILLHFGLQRSGTNYLEALFKRMYGQRFSNSNADRKSPLQKHFRLYDNKDMVPEPQYRNDIVITSFSQFEGLYAATPDFYLVISKDPYSWYLSYTAWAKKCNWPPPRHHYIEEYNLFYGKFLELAAQTEKILFVRYVDLLRDREVTLTGLERRMGLTRKPRHFLISRAFSRVPQSTKFSDEQRDNYLKKNYLGMLSRENLNQLNARLDPRVIELLGYEIADGG
jgi:hypothetical protein